VTLQSKKASVQTESIQEARGRMSDQNFGSTRGRNIGAAAGSRARQHAGESTHPQIKWREVRVGLPEMKTRARIRHGSDDAMMALTMVMTLVMLLIMMTMVMLMFVMMMIMVMLVMLLMSLS